MNKSLLQSCMHYPYQAFLNGTGLTVKPFRIQWYTTAFNRTTIKWANSWSKLYTLSFDIGVFASLLLLPSLFVWHLITLYSSSNDVSKLRGDNVGRNAKGSIELELMLPGINLPLNEIGYYVTALGISSIVHEIGHAFAAVLEDIPVLGFGLHILLTLPIAYTELSTDQLNSLRTWRKLRVFCAGIWHNILLAAFCFLLFSMLSIVLVPFYNIDNSVTVTSITPDSPIKGEKGLQLDDVITDINDCKVKNIYTWYDCLAETIRNPPAYCIPSEYVLEHDESVPVYHSNEGVTECCDQRNQANMCFEYLTPDGSTGLLELPQFMCLNVRRTIEHSVDFCHRTNGRCLQSFCIKPLMNNATTLIHIKRIQKRDVMFIGHPSDLAYTIKVSPYVPKTFLFNAHFADSVSLLLNYTIVFSLGLAIVNVIPCFCFDGHHITTTITNHFLQNLVPERHKREMIGIAITSVGTLFFVIILLRSLNNSLKQFF